jgi:hypothetical protein
VGKAGKLSRARYFWIAAGLLLSIMAGVGISSGVQENATADEAVNLSAGFSYLTLRDYRMDPEHPPLGQMLNAIPYGPKTSIPAFLGPGSNGGCMKPRMLQVGLGQTLSGVEAESVGVRNWAVHCEYSE